LKTVLIVDDDEAIRKLLKMQLEIEGYAVVVTSDKEGALKALAAGPLMAVLLDLHLTGSDGFQILPEIRRVKPDLPVIMVTGSHDEEEARKAFSLGAWDYVTKPIDFNYLKNILLMQSKQ
jgi:DNA-binding response OmpR family regulator